MKLSFIGMSGVGKSHWAKQLANHGYKHLDCDAMIAERLGEFVSVNNEEDPVHAVGRWMGMPWSDGYAEREARYLELEGEVTASAINRISEQGGDSAVIDTTGSVIYTGEPLLGRLKNLTRVVYFDVPDAVRREMVELYLDELKPVLWRGMYRPEPGEPQADALARCYAELLADRGRRYKALADVVLDYHALRGEGFNAEQLIERVTS